MARIELDHVVSEAGDVRILDGVTFGAEDGEFIGLIGPSGAGKTSIVRAIAGLDPVTSGVIRFDGEDVTAMPVRDRDIGLITQGNTLFPTYRVRRNISFPLLNRAFGKAETRKRVNAESRSLNIEHILERWPSTLSGGEERLAHIARALVRIPRVFLMDEPMAKLDPPTRHRLREELVLLQKGYGVTTIYVSNRPSEIMRMPDRLVAIQDGRVTQTGRPVDVRLAPASRAIAELTGPIGLLRAVVEADSDGYWLTGEGIRLRAWSPALGEHVQRPVEIGVRAEDVRVVDVGPISLTARGMTFDSSPSIRTLHSPAGSIGTTDPGLAEGDRVVVRLDRWHAFELGGRRIMTAG